MASYARDMKKKNLIIASLAAIIIIYALLLIPEHDISHKVSNSIASKKQPFAWNKDDYWAFLEARYKDAQKSGCQNIAPIIATQIGKVESLLKQIAAKWIMQLRKLC